MHPLAGRDRIALQDGALATSAFDVAASDHEVAIDGRPPRSAGERRRPCALDLINFDAPVALRKRSAVRPAVGGWVSRTALSGRWRRPTGTRHKRYGGEMARCRAVPLATAGNRFSSDDGADDREFSPSSRAGDAAAPCAQYGCPHHGRRPGGAVRVQGFVGGVVVFVSW